MVDKCFNYIDKQDKSRPFHLIRKGNDTKRWQKVGLWLELERGEDNINKPLTSCLKFSFVEDKERRDYKSTNFEQNKLILKRFNYLVKLQGKAIKNIKK